MGSSRIDLTICLQLQEAEAKLLFDYANSSRQSIPEAVIDMMLVGLTLGTDRIATFELPEKISPPSAGLTITAATPPDGGAQAPTPPDGGESRTAPAA